MTSRPHDEVRRQVTEAFLVWMLAGARHVQRVPDADIDEFEAFVNALLSGGDHPALLEWEAAVASKQRECGSSER
jgi:hypothetical protein